MHREYKTTLQQREYAKKQRLEHPEYMRNYMRKWIKNNPEKKKAMNDVSNLKRIKFKGVQIFIGLNPRTGVCSNCKRSIQKGEIKRTHMHHLDYNPNNPLDSTIELCVRCHRHMHVKN